MTCASRCEPAWIDRAVCRRRHDAQAIIRLQFSLALDYEVFDKGCDFIFNIHVAHTERQRVVDEALTLSQDVVPNVETDPATRNRYMRVRAFAGPLKVVYSATSTLGITSPSPARSPRFPWRACPRTCSVDDRPLLRKRSYDRSWPSTPIRGRPVLTASSDSKGSEKP